jgi:hypothetical protein
MARPGQNSRGGELIEEVQAEAREHLHHIGNY